MNAEHLRLCASDEWAQYLIDELLPFALGDHLLGAHGLEIGPGPGRTTDVLRQRAGRLTAVEHDADLARALGARLGGTNVTVAHADATAMPFADNAFSGAACLTMLHHVPTVSLQDELFAETARVLAPGAVLFALDSRDSPSLRELHVDDTYNPVDLDTLAGRLARAGFASASVTTTEHRVCFRAVR